MSVMEFGKYTAAGVIAILSLSLFLNTSLRADETRLQIALDLAAMLQAARSVISENQDLINNPNIGDKNLTSMFVKMQVQEKFESDQEKLEFSERGSESTLRDKLLIAMLDSVGAVMDANQSTINKKGVAFKGFVPAVFARLVNEEFERRVGEFAKVKVTAPPELVRNRKARPDAWETAQIKDRFLSPTWTKGDVFAGSAPARGQNAFRVLVPEYYGEACLSCHGEPKGTLDVTGYPKEGGKLGDLGGVISITLYDQ